MKKKIAIIGGGAAGMMAAITAAKAGADVELYERNDRVGKKILATGNGKCNFSNTQMSAEAYFGSAVSKYETLFSKFGVNETIAFFEKEGMLIKDKNGYLYPASEQASTVLDILRFALEKYHVNVITDAKIEKIKPMGNGQFQIQDKGLGNPKYDALILACGGMAAPKTGSDGNGFVLAKSFGHQITDLVPALVQLRCKEDFFKSVAGVRTGAEMTLLIDGKKRCVVQGELQLTDYGISGIPVFQFSREAAYALLQHKKVTVSINFLPQYTKEAYEQFWKERYKRQKGQSLEQFLTGIANKKINQLMIRLSGLCTTDKVEELSQDTYRKIAEYYRALTVTIQKANGFEQAQVSAGGVLADELCDMTLESKLVPNLYFAGEIIDMDGICGGYNLQWAWTSGYIAGSAAVGRKI